jgi:hypothetical protein
LIAGNKKIKMKTATTIAAITPIKSKFIKVVINEAGKNKNKKLIAGNTAARN